MGCQMPYISNKQYQDNFLCTVVNWVQWLSWCILSAFGVSFCAWGRAVWGDWESVKRGMIDASSTFWTHSSTAWSNWASLYLHEFFFSNIRTVHPISEAQSTLACVSSPLVVVHGDQLQGVHNEPFAHVIVTCTTEAHGLGKTNAPQVRHQTMLQKQQTHHLWLYLCYTTLYLCSL